MKLSEINENLKFKIAAPVDFSAKFIQCGKNAETGEPWVKAQFRAAGKTYLFTRDIIVNNMSNAFAMLEQYGKIQIGKRISEKLGIDTKIEVNISPDGIKTIENERLEKFISSIQIVENTIKENWNAEMFERGMIMPDFRDAFENIQHVEDFNGESVKLIIGNTILTEWHDTGVFGKKASSPLWTRGIAPLMWYGIAIPDNEQNTDFDSADVPFGMIENDIAPITEE